MRCELPRGHPRLLVKRRRGASRPALRASAARTRRSATFSVTTARSSSSARSRISASELPRSPDRSPPHSPHGHASAAPLRQRAAASRRGAASLPGESLLAPPLRPGPVGFCIQAIEPGVDLFAELVVVPDSNLHLQGRQKQVVYQVPDLVPQVALPSRGGCALSPKRPACSERRAASGRAGTEHDPRVPLHAKPFLDEALRDGRPGLPALAALLLQVLEKPFLDEARRPTGTARCGRSWRRCIDSH